MIRKYLEEKNLQYLSLLQSSLFCGKCTNTCVLYTCLIKTNHKPKLLHITITFKLSKLNVETIFIGQENITSMYITLLSNSILELRNKKGNENEIWFRS